MTTQHCHHHHRCHYIVISGGGGDSGDSNLLLHAQEEGDAYSFFLSAKRAYIIYNHLDYSINIFIGILYTYIIRAYSSVHTPTGCYMSHGAFLPTAKIPME